jgi:cytoskeleton protein RodZ
MDTAVHTFESDGQPPHPGPRLAAERQRLGWSVGDVAAKLRMSIAQVEALERADYSRLPTGTFLRGFVRSYAKLLGADPDSALELLERAHADGRRPGIVVPSQNIKIRVPGERPPPVSSRTLLLLALVLTLTVGFGYWWFFIKPTQGGAARGSATVPAKAPQASLAVQQPATQLALADLPATPLPPLTAADTGDVPKSTSAPSGDPVKPVAAGKTDAASGLANGPAKSATVASASSSETIVG